MDNNRIKVGVRVRPLSSKEQQEGANNTVITDNNGRILIGADQKKQPFQFDWTFGTNSEQQAIYDTMCKPLIDKYFEGYNATFFAYGQTGSGKTYTMGTANDFQNGVIPYAVQDIFAKKAEIIHQGGQVCIELSYIEIYMEDCFDLLNKDQEKKKLELRETSNGETYLDGLTSLPIHTLSDVVQYLTMASKIRSTGKTAMNSHSSRSHAICMFTIRIVKEDSSFMAKLNLVDLAGSERAKKTMATGDAFQEGVSINKGLLALGNVVSALSMKAKQSQQEASSNKSNTTATSSNTASSKTNTSSNSTGHIHVPYRESKLTRLLKDSLGGNGMTALLACVSPASNNYDETLNTLRFANRTASIVNMAKVNIDSQADASSLLKEVHRLRDQLSSLQCKYDQLNVDHSKGMVTKNSSVAAADGSMSSQQNTASNNEDITAYLMSSQKLASSLRMLLMQCFEEDLFVPESELYLIQQEFQDIRMYLGYDDYVPSTSSAGGSNPGDMMFDDLMMLSGGGNMEENEEMQKLFQDLQMSMNHMETPPIVSVIDEIKHLEKSLKKSLKHRGDKKQPQPSAKTQKRKIAEISTNQEDANATVPSNTRNAEIASRPQPVVAIEDLSDIMMEQDDGDAAGSDGRRSSTSSNNSFLSTSSSEPHAIHDAEDDIYATKANMAAKEVQMNLMISKTKQYQKTIQTLKDDIDNLEKERVQLTSQEQSLSNNPSQNIAVKANESQRIKQMMKEKTKLLEEKMKLLRQREADYLKLCRVQEKLTKDHENLKHSLVEIKRKKVEMMIQMKQQDVQHRMESKAMIKQDLQAKKQMTKMSIKQQRYELQIQQKERHFQSKLAEKEKENRMLQQLLEKRQHVQEQRAQKFNTSNKATASSAALTSSNASSSSATNGTSLLKEVIQRDKQLASLQAKLSFVLQAKRSLVQQKIQKKSQVKALRITSHGYKMLQEEIQFLSADIKEKQKEVLDIQQAIGNINASNATVSSGASATAVGVNPMAILFNQSPSSENINDLKAMLSTLYTFHTQTLQDQAKLQLQLNQLQMLLPPPDMSDEDDGEEDLEDVDEDEEDAEEVMEMDETFYPSEEEEEYNSGSSSDDEKGNWEEVNSSDESFGPHKKPRKTSSRSKKVKATKKTTKNGKAGKRQSTLNTSNSSNSTAGDEDFEEANTSASSADMMDSILSNDSSIIMTAPKKRAAPKKVKDAGEDIAITPDEINQSHWMKLTVKDLKQELSNRGMPVSGVKQELVKRLLIFDRVFQASPAIETEEGSEELEVDQETEAILDSMVVAEENVPEAQEVGAEEVAAPFNTSTEQPSVKRSVLTLPFSEFISNDENTENVLISRSEDDNIVKFRTSSGKVDFDAMEEDLKLKKRRLIQTASHGNHLGWFEEEEILN